MPRSFTAYHSTCSRIIDAFGTTRTVESLGTVDFEVFSQVIDDRSWTARAW